MSEKTCAERVEKNFKDRAAYISGVFEYFDLPETQRAAHPLADEMEDYSVDSEFDALMHNALSFDFVEDDENPRAGYWRYQLSWGGPSDEFRIYLDERMKSRIKKIDYHFMDWFDGARMPVDYNTNPAIFWAADMLVEAFAQN